MVYETGSPQEARLKPQLSPNIPDRRARKGRAQRSVCYDTRGAAQHAALGIPTMVHSGTFQVDRPAEEVFELLANPERFAPLMPDFESMAMQDATHFTLRTVLAMGEIKRACQPGDGVGRHRARRTVGLSGRRISRGARFAWESISGSINWRK